jgi:hypothetical protein
VWYFYGSSAGRFKPNTKIGIGFFSAKHAALRRNRKELTMTSLYKDFRAK